MTQHIYTSAAELLARLREAGMTLWEENGDLRYRAPKGNVTDRELQLLRANKEELRNELRAESRQWVTPDPKSQHEPFPLTDVQSAYVLGRHDLFGYGGVGCHIYLELSYPELDPERAEKAWNILIGRHDMLRATMDQDGEQRVMASVPAFKVKFTDIRELSVQQADDTLATIRNDMGHRLYETGCWPFFDIAVTRTRDSAIMHVSVDFLIADWASVWMLLSEFETLYQEPGRILPALELSFRDYVLAERGLQETASFAKDQKYWLGRVDDLPSAPDLPLTKKSDPPDTARFRRRSLKLNQSAWDRLKQQAQLLGVTPTAAVMTAYAAVLERWSRSKRFCLNLTMLNRLPLHPQVGDIVGDFTSVNLLAVEWRSGQPFGEQAKAFQRQLFEDLDHRLFSGVKVMREIARRRGREASLMPIVFTSAIGIVQSAQSDPLTNRIGGYSISQTPQVFIDCQAMDSPTGLQVNWDVREGVFPDGMIDDMFDCFEALLRLLAIDGRAWNECENISLPVWQLMQRQHVNDTHAPLPERQLHELVLAQAIATPDRPAVISSDGEMTYGELAERAAGVAEKLIASGCEEQDRVAIVMEKGVEQVVAVLGALYAGTVYVPIDMNQPELRRFAILEQAGIRYALTCSTTGLSWPDDVQTIHVDRLASRSFQTARLGRSVELPAYVIYTSGSTGKPKGVVISHRGAANTVAEINRRFGLHENDRVLGLAQLGFDLSVYDMFGPLSAGGAVVYPDPSRMTDPSHWAELMARHEVSIWNSVPALMQMLVDYLHNEPRLSLPGLRLALLSGDWIPLTLPDRLLGRLPAVQTVSLGGATEASIWSICHIYEGLQPDWLSIPYGRPLANQGFRVLDLSMRDCPVWVTGELYISGLGLAEGYLGDAEMTQKRFVLHPADGQRLYRTGDLGRYTPDGNIEFLGREDHQVKIRGHRIELGEIESALMQHPSIALAGVVVDRIGEDHAMLGVVELARKQERNSAAEQAEFDKLTSGIGKLVSDEEGLARADVKVASDSMDRAVLLSMLDALLKLGLFKGDEKLSVDDIVQLGGIAPQFHWLVRRWLDKLTASGLLLAHSSERYSCPQQQDGSRLSSFWEHAKGAWTNKLSSSVFIEYVRSNAEQLPELLRGRQDPVTLLFPEGRLDVVSSLYVDHRMANYLNQCICALLKRIAEDYAAAGKPLRILEVGAGSGATTQMVLDTLAGFDTEYVFTDISSFFLPGAKARFGHYPGIRFGLFDIDRDYREQGLAPNSYDVVLAAGVLENARDIPASMNKLMELISPGGWLVFTEPTEEHAWILASQAFMMAEPEDLLRTATSYLDRDGWLRLLQEYQDGSILILPDEKHPLSALGYHMFARRVKQDRQQVRVSELMAFISQRLPAHMLPSYLQVADALPLTGNGKIDRRELTLWRPKSIIDNPKIEADVVSSDPLEAQLAQLWAEALSIPGIGRSQSFYDHGADSLIMAQVAGKLRDKLATDTEQRNIAFDSLLRHMLNFPTVAELAEFIRSRNPEPGQVDHEAGPKPPTVDGTSNAVLTLCGSMDTGPLRVVFHAGLGTLNGFRLLLEHLEAQRLGPVIGITVADAETYCELDPSILIEQIADDYAGRLLETGHRHMQLIGYSLGGLIAIEVGRRLVENDIQLADLVLIDSHAVLFDVDDDLILESLFLPNLSISIQQAGFGVAGADDLVRGMLHILDTNNNSIPQGASLTLGGDEGLNKAGDLFRELAALTLRERFSAYVEAIAITTGEHMTVEMAEALFKLFKHSFKAARFTPSPYMGSIRFLLAVESSGFLPGMEQLTLEFWRDVCLGEFEVTEIAGNHFNCIEDEPYAADLASLLATPFVK